jgi:starch synthase (maltosyl-transferring)
VTAFSKRDGDDVVLVVCTLDPISTREATVWWDMAALGLDDADTFTAHDEVTGGTWQWGRGTYVRLDPGTVAHIVHVRSSPVPGAGPA